MDRVGKLKQIAVDNGVTATIRELGQEIFASVGGVSFKVRGFASFDAKCKELRDYVAPAPIELTEKLEKIETAAMKNYAV